jgi:hypothetical protein
MNDGLERNGGEMVGKRREKRGKRGWNLGRGGPMHFFCSAPKRKPKITQFETDKMLGVDSIVFRFEEGTCCHLARQEH